LIFVHRDAEREALTVRQAEVQRAVIEARQEKPTVRGLSAFNALEAQVSRVAAQLQR
jgi:hypothetical protein